MSEGSEQIVDPVSQQEGGSDEIDERDTTLPWQRIQFHGSGSEYFRIWIVNLLLTILTLGIYSAWATVRQRRYFYGNTELADGRFDFHGKPLQILIGRVIALVLLIGWTQGANLHIAVPFVALGILGALFPWFLVKAMNFRLRNTSLRNLRFNFNASTFGSYKVSSVYLLIFFALIGFMAWFTVYMMAGIDMTDAESIQNSGIMMKLFAIYGVVTLIYAFAYPAFVCDIRRFSINETDYGQSSFFIRLRRSSFIGYFWAAIGLFVITMLLISVFFGITMVVVGALVESDSTSETGLSSIMMIVIGLSYLLFGFIYFFVYAYWKVRIFNLTINGLVLVNTRFRSDMEVIGLAKILATNALMVLLTLGFAYPWAKVRVMRYTLEAVEYQGDANQFSGQAEQGRNAVGDEVGEAFDIEFGF